MYILLFKAVLVTSQLVINARKSSFSDESRFCFVVMEVDGIVPHHTGSVDPSVGMNHSESPPSEHASCQDKFFDLA